jgi:hypothetical protein
LAEEEFGLCTTSDGLTYGVHMHDLESFGDFVHGDRVSMRLAPEEGRTVLGNRFHKVISMEMLHRVDRQALDPSVENVFNILVISTKWTDMESASEASLNRSHNSAKRMIRQAAYSSFRPPSDFITVTMPKAWQDASKDCTQARKDIFDRIPNVTQYVYQMIFFPKGHKCAGGWAGLAVVGCGVPSESPNGRFCWSMYQGGVGESHFVQGHELGHNFGFRHAGGANKNGKFVEYGDPKHIMGNSYDMNTTFSAAHRYQIDWLKDKSGEMVTYKGTALVYSISSLTETKSYPGADGVAAKFSCPTCVSEVERFQHLVGGDSVISFSYGRVYVHYSRGLRKGTEAWAILERGQGWQNKYGQQAVHVCSTSGQIARVAIARTASRAKRTCGNR